MAIGTAADVSVFPERAGGGGESSECGSTIPWAGRLDGTKWKTEDARERHSEDIGWMTNAGSKINGDRKRRLGRLIAPWREHLP